jgi:hypothetical protein
LSGKLVGEVVDWLRTPAAAGLTDNERLVLMLVAERSHERTRDMWRHKADDETLSERMAACLGVTQKVLGAVLGRLAARGLECRVPLGVDKKGRPVFATRSRATSFRLPELPASVTLPTGEWSRREGTISDPCPVDNPTVDAHQDEEMVPSERDHSANGPVRTGPFTANGPFTTGPYPSTDLPSEDNPSNPSDPSSVVAVEDAASSRASFEEEKFDQDEYRMAQQQLLDRPDCGAPFLARAAAAEPSARHEVRIIHAARLAKGIPA